MAKFLEFALVVSDGLKSPEAKEVYAGVLAILACVITAELILGMF
jgi:hypothetical protein